MKTEYVMDEDHEMNTVVHIRDPTDYQRLEHVHGRMDIDPEGFRSLVKHLVIKYKGIYVKNQLYMFFKPTDRIG